MSIIKEEKQTANLRVSVRKLVNRDSDDNLFFEQNDLLQEYETTYQNHISYQARQALMQNGISSLYELRKLSKQTLLDFKGFGERSYQKLVKFGYLFE
jgi:DNA-directed RNA polymerase alpha subunit